MNINCKKKAGFIALILISFVNVSCNKNEKLNDHSNCVNLSKDKPANKDTINWQHDYEINLKKCMLNKNYKFKNGKTDSTNHDSWEKSVN